MIRAIISDFDGTLVDTFEANYRAYSESFENVGLRLTRETYRECFGLRFDKFMDTMEVTDIETRHKIKELKGNFYPQYFEFLRVNTPLLEFIRMFRKMGGKTAIASTAREKNLRNVLRHIGAEGDFDLILAGESVTKGKPDPEIYNTVLEKLGIPAEEAIVFEDSEVGFKAADAAGIQYIRINNFDREEKKGKE